MAKPTRSRQSSKNTPAKSDSSLDLEAILLARPIRRPSYSRHLFENTSIGSDASVIALEISTPGKTGKRTRGRPSLRKTPVGNLP